MRRIASFIPLGLFVCLPGVVCVTGCSDTVKHVGLGQSAATSSLALITNETLSQSSTPSSRASSSSSSAQGPTASRKEIKVQGRLEPKGGFIRLAGLPGDRIEAWHVRPGDAVQAGTQLATLFSRTVKSLELEAAKLKLEEAKTTLETKLEELNLGIEVALEQLENAEGLVEIAESQRAMAAQGEGQLLQLREQLDSLTRLHLDPLTRAAVGKLELQSKEMEITNLESKSQQAVLAADNGLKQAHMQVRQAQQAVQAARMARELAEKNVSIAALEKQIEVLSLQVDEASLVSPISGVVLNINVEAGERFATLPAAELADLSAMMCVAEVYEADVAEIQIGDSAVMRSAGLKKDLSGKVARIDRLVGVPQMRSPDPLARTDFRAVRVWIDISEEDTAIAAERIRLQADVTIRPSR